MHYLLVGMVKRDIDREEVEGNPTGTSACNPMLLYLLNTNAGKDSRFFSTADAIPKLNSSCPGLVIRSP